MHSHVHVHAMFDIFKYKNTCLTLNAWSVCLFDQGDLKHAQVQPVVYGAVARWRTLLHWMTSHLINLLDEAKTSEGLVIKKLQ